MHTTDLNKWTHRHDFAIVDQGNERRTTLVVALTALMMAVEIVAGFVYGSMALLADGWHMATHVAALGISVFAYRYARWHTANPRFTFGTGKVGVLGGFTSAIVLAGVALFMIGESVIRFFSKSTIRFDEAIFVAAIGLAVNVVSAAILKQGGDRDEHPHEHPHDSYEHAHHHHDHNLRAAYLHVVADALTSVLAIVALTAGKWWGQVWLDPLMGVIGGILIARWSWGLIRDTSRILLDAVAEKELLESIRSAIETGGDDRVSDLHVWRVGPGTCAAIVAIVSDHPQQPASYRQRLTHIRGLSHVTVEVHHCSCQTDPPQPGGR